MKLTRDTHFIELLRKGGSSLVLRVCGSGLSFLLALYLARTLGASDYGLFTLALTIITVISVLVRFGLGRVLVREISSTLSKHNYDLARGYFYSTTRLILVIGVCATLAGIFLTPALAVHMFNKPNLEDPLFLMMFALLPFCLLNIFSEALKGLRDISAASLVESVLLPGISLIVFIAFGYLAQWSLHEIIIVYVAAAVFASMVGRYLWSLRIPKGEVTKVTTKKLINMGFPLLLAASGGLIISWTDILVVGIFEESALVGVYTISAKIALLATIVLASVNSIAAPKFAAFYASNDLKGMARLARQSAMLMTVIVFLPSLVIIIWSTEILGVFGAEYRSGSNVLIILVLGQLVNVMCGSVNNLLVMSNNEGVVKNILLIVAVINVILNIYLVKIYSIEGVAFATAISVIIWNIWMLVEVKRRLGFWVIYPDSQKPGRDF